MSQKDNQCICRIVLFVLLFSLCVLRSDADTVASAVGHEEPSGVALVIGNDYYGADTPAFLHASADAKAWLTLLRERCGYPQNRVFYLCGSAKNNVPNVESNLLNAKQIKEYSKDKPNTLTKRMLLAACAKFLIQCEKIKPTHVFVFYAGYGAGENMLCADNEVFERRHLFYVPGEGDFFADMPNKPQFVYVFDMRSLNMGGFSPPELDGKTYYVSSSVDGQASNANAAQASYQITGVKNEVFANRFLTYCLIQEVSQQLEQTGRTEIGVLRSRIDTLLEKLCAQTKAKNALAESQGKPIPYNPNQRFYQKTSDRDLVNPLPFVLNYKAR